MRILLVHPQFDTIGGAELVAMRVIALLINKYNADVTLLTLNPDQDIYNRCKEFIDLDPRLLSIQIADCPRWIRKNKDRLHLLRLAYVHRHAKKIAAKYDLCISTYNEIDFGRQGLQYIHHPNFASRALMHSYKMISKRNSLDIIPVFEKIYYNLVSRISNGNVKGFRSNISVVNSEFMKKIIYDAYKINADVIYPSLPTIRLRNRRKCWEERKFQFLSVGRISPDKNLTELIELFEHMSRNFPGAKFLIIGRIVDKNYYNALCKIIKNKKCDINVLTNIDREHLDNYYDESKFYISPKHYEHFGIAVLEAVHAGCLPFVHDSGGQREIITPNLLRYKSSDELMNNILALLKHEDLRSNVFEEINNVLQKLRPENFDEAVSERITSLLKMRNMV